jgi:hypothetical protein
MAKKKRKKVAQPIRLNVGAGKVEIPGYTAIDRTLGTEAYPLTNYEDNSVDEVRASHILEHFPRGQVFPVVQEWVRVLKPNGVLKLAVPNFDWIAEHYHRHACDSQTLFGYLMGGQLDENDYHKSVFDETLVRLLMKAAGIDRIQPWVGDALDCSRLPVSLNLMGQKMAPLAKVAIPKIVACMSTAKLGFTENLFCAAGAFFSRNIDVHKCTGAFWGQCLERVMEDAIDIGAEWIVTLDYDTVFTTQIFDKLCYLLATHPEADAIAPWQMQRDTNDPLCWFTDETGLPRREIPLMEFDKPLSKVDTAHFGLTLIRVSGLAKMKHPWFYGRPNKEGKWGEHRIDDDISFWQQWKAVGNTLYLANNVSIGHLQQLATWPSEFMQPIHQYVPDFQKHGVPQGARQ